MPKWEYKTVLVISGFVSEVDNQPVRELNMAFDIHCLNTLGEDGWELVVQDVRHENPVQSFLIFKRPQF